MRVGATGGYRLSTFNLNLDTYPQALSHSNEVQGKIRKRKGKKEKNFSLHEKPLQEI